MNLKELSAKLRKAADMLDELVGVNLNLPTKNETKETAKKIVKKLHWTQMRKNKTKMLRNVKKAIKAKRP